MQKLMPPSNDDSQIGEKRRNHLEIVDSLPSDLRALIHEFGYPVINSFLQNGIRKPNQIRQIIVEVWYGTREEGQKRQRRGPMMQLDKILMDAGADISSERLVKMFNDYGWALVPFDPMPCMINASLNEMNDHSIRCTKSEKHARRLRAAIKACSKYLLS